jgi:hypothetical protein
MKAIPVLWTAAFLSAAAPMFAARDIDKQIGQRIEKVQTTAYTHGAAREWHPWQLKRHWRAPEVRRAQRCGGGLVALALGDTFSVVETGREYIIDHVGGAIVGTNTIELFKPNSRAMQRRGVREVTIEILEWGSLEESLEILMDRRKSRPAGNMVERLLVQNAT